MAKIITITNQKGGVGKTSVATTLVDSLNRCNYKTLLLDVDPQANSSSYFGAQIEGEYTLFDVIEKNCTPAEAVQHCSMGDIIAGDPQLSPLEDKYKSSPRAYKLYDKIIKELGDEYDFIVIDTPPNLGLYLKNALVISNGVIIPITTTKFAIDGLSLLLDTIDEVVGDEINPDLKIYGVLMVAYDNRKSLARETKAALEEIGKSAGFSLFQTAIRSCEAVNKSQAMSLSLFDYDAKSNAANDYFNFVKELIGIVG